MSTMDWNKYGKDFTEVNRNLNGLPEWLVKTGRGLKKGLDWTERNISAPFNAAVGGAVDMALGGLPSASIHAVANKINPENVGKPTLWEQAGAEHPIAAGIGQGAGLAGAVLAPELAAMKGITLGAAGAGLGSTLARNALLSSAYAVPAAGAEAMRTGDVGKAAKRGLLNLGLGTGIGTAAEMAGPLLTNLKLLGAGIRPRDLIKTLGKRASASGVGAKGREGFAVRNTKDLKEEIAALLGKFGASKGGKRGIIDMVSGGYKKLGQVYDASGQKVVNMLDEILSDPQIVKAVSMYGKPVVDDAIQEIIGIADQLPWQEGYSGILRDIQTKGQQAADPLSAMAAKGDVARIIRGKMGEAADAIRLATGRADIPPIAYLNQIQDASKAVQSSLARQGAQIPGMVAGSDTAARVGLMPGSVTSSVTGGLLGAAGARKPRRLEDWPAYLAKVGGASLAGGLLNRVSSGAVNRLAFPIAEGISRALPAIGAIGRPLAAMGAANSLMETPQIPGAAATAPQTTPQIQAGEQSSSPSEVKQAQTATNEAFSAKVMEALRRDWEMVNAEAAGTPYELSFEDFAVKVREITNDFDPKLAAPILFRDPEVRAKYLKTYEQALALKGMDLAGAFGGMRFLDPERDKNILAKRSLQNWMTGLIGGPEKMADPNLSSLVEKDIAALRALRLPVADKQAALRRLLQTNYGIDFDLLNQYGVGI